MNVKEPESINVTNKCNKEGDKHKENSNVYDNKGQEKTLGMFEKKEKACDGYARMYECGKNYFIQRMNVRAYHMIWT